jgi:hypothetical protein
MTLHPISGKSYFLLLALLLISALSSAQTAVPVVLAPVPQLQFFDQSGRPLSFGCVSTFQSQTTNPLATFTDFTGQFQNPNPVILSAGGSANIWLQSGQAYSLTVKSSGGTNCSLGQTLYTVDGVGGGASQLNTVVTPSGGSAAFTVQSQNQLFSLTLTGNVAGSPVSFIGVIAPALVTFQITEDGGGAHTFSWPSNVTGGAPIDTVANHTTSQTFIWNGTSILPVGSGFNSAGNSIIPGTLQSASVAFANSGVFTNTQMNDPFTAVINGINFNTEYQALQGNNTSTEGFASGVAIPSTSTAHQADGIAGFINNSSTLTNGVGGYFQARCLANSTACWGSNIVSGDGPALTSVTLYGLEVDAAPLSNAASYAGVFGISSNISGATGTGNYGSAFLAVSNVAGKFWNHGFETKDGAVQTAFLAGGTCASGSCGSQALSFRSFNGGGAITSSIAASTAGSIQLNPATGQDVAIGLGLAPDGSGFKHKRVASCTTAASGNATCATTVTWTTAFADANYTLSCTLIGPGTAFVLESSTPVAASATVTIMNAPGSSIAASGTLDCYGVHD